jgi:hypothetical protein
MEVRRRLPPAACGGPGLEGAVGLSLTGSIWGNGERRLRVRGKEVCVFLIYPVVSLTDKWDL